MDRLSSDINRARDVINNNNFMDFNTVYSFSNEDLVSCFKDFNFKNKDCLTVLASSDQALDMFLKGAKDITTFDINPLTRYYFYLKKAALLSNISLQDYVNFFGTRKFFSGEDFYKKIFDKLFSNLDRDNLSFWKQLLHEFPVVQIKYNLFVIENYDFKSLQESINYLNEENYQKLCQIIKTKNIDFINCNIKDLPGSLSKSYDYIYLSNIAQYLDIVFSQGYSNKEAYKKLLCKYKELILNLANNLNTSGEICAAYTFRANKNQDSKCLIDYFCTYGNFGVKRFNSGENSDASVVYRR